MFCKMLKNPITLGVKKKKKKELQKQNSLAHTRLLSPKPSRSLQLIFPLPLDRNTFHSSFSAIPSYTLDSTVIFPPINSVERSYLKLFPLSLPFLFSCTARQKNTAIAAVPTSVTAFHQLLSTAFYKDKPALVTSSGIANNPMSK